MDGRRSVPVNRRDDFGELQSSGGADRNGGRSRIGGQRRRNVNLGLRTESYEIVVHMRPFRGQAVVPLAQRVHRNDQKYNGLPDQRGAGIMVSMA